MKYICSATIKDLPEQPQDWLSFLTSILKLNASQAALVNQATVFQHPDHIQASCFFRTAFDALYRLRQANAFNIELSPTPYKRHISSFYPLRKHSIFLLPNRNT